jgi:hypothetical protein
MGPRRGQVAEAYDVVAAITIFAAGGGRSPPAMSLAAGAKALYGIGGHALDGADTATLRMLRAAEIETGASMTWAELSLAQHGAAYAAAARQPAAKREAVTAACAAGLPLPCRSCPSPPRLQRASTGG